MLEEQTCCSAAAPWGPAIQAWLPDAEGRCHDRAVALLITEKGAACGECRPLLSSRRC